MSDDPELKDRWQGAIEMAKDNAKLQARANAYKALNGDLELNDKELADYSLKFLQLTDDSFNPTQRVDSRTATVNFDLTTDQIKEELRKLAVSIN
jgi:hypothetical protein